MYGPGVVGARFDVVVIGCVVSVVIHSAIGSFCVGITWPLRCICKYNYLTSPWDISCLLSAPAHLSWADWSGCNYSLHMSATIYLSLDAIPEKFVAQMFCQTGKNWKNQFGNFTLHFILAILELPHSRVGLCSRSVCVHHWYLFFRFRVLLHVVRARPPQCTWVGRWGWAGAEV